MLLPLVLSFFLFFFNDTGPTEIYPLSLHDALPICIRAAARASGSRDPGIEDLRRQAILDRKSTRLNSSHRCTSYAVFCLKQNRPAAGRRPLGARCCALWLSGMRACTG